MVCEWQESQPEALWCRWVLLPFFVGLKSVLNDQSTTEGGVSVLMNKWRDDGVVLGIYQICRRDRCNAK